MATSKKSNDKPTDDIDIELALFEAMCAHGLILPMSPEAVARAEQEVVPNQYPLPSSLCEPPDFEKGDDDPRAIIPMTPPPSEAQRNLARAAREGKEVLPEIEARMHVDRLKAEEAKGG